MDLYKVDSTQGKHQIEKMLNLNQFALHMHMLKVD